MHPIENIMRASMEQIKDMVDVNTVIGDPVETSESTMILPVSKVSLAFLVGGGEYGEMSAAKKSAAEADSSRFPFAGASAAGMSITPLAFLTVEDGNVRVLPANQKCVTDRLMDMAPHAMKCIEKLIKNGLECLCSKCGCGNDSSNGSGNGSSGSKHGCNGNAGKGHSRQNGCNEPENYNSCDSYDNCQNGSVPNAAVNASSDEEMDEGAENE